MKGDEIRKFDGTRFLQWARSIESVLLKHSWTVNLVSPLRTLDYVQDFEYVASQAHLNADE